MTTSLIADGFERPIGYLFVARDVTDTRRSQEILRKALQREQLAVDHLRALDDAKDDFVTTVSHELRTPMTSIIGSAELLEDGMAGELAPRAEADGRRDRAQRRPPARDGQRPAHPGQLREHRGPGEPARAARPAGRGARRATRRSPACCRPATCELDEDLPDRPVLVNGEPIHLERAVTNLLSNAVKFTRDGGRIVDQPSRWTATGTCTAERHRHRARHPRGRDPGRLRPVLPVQHVRSDAIQGTGLGPVDREDHRGEHDGQIDVHSNAGEGTTFTITLPRSARPELMLD